MDKTRFHFIALITPNGEPSRVVAGPFMRPPSRDLMALAHLLCTSPVTDGWSIQSVNTAVGNTLPGGQLHAFTAGPSVMGGLGLTTKDIPFVSRWAALLGVL